MSEYAFGDTDLAAERLRILDTVFAPTSDALLELVRDLTPVGPDTVADLGCGPGATTARLVHRFPAARVTGLDASAAFLTAARVATPGAAFATTDVTRPLPHAPFDLVYARFLLAHLSDVPAAIGHWLRSVRPGGVVVLEETESISSADPVFARYEELSVARVAHAGADVYAGPAVRAALDALPGDVVLDRVLTLDLTAGEAAAMFWRNLATWGHDAVAQGLITEPDRAALLSALRDREDDPTRGRFTWTHHQTVLRRPG
jgi:SAM-dependent methyltransferase